MTTIDTLLIELFQQGIEKLDSQIPNRDKRILISLARQINSGNFLTENQAKLLLKILKESSQYITTFSTEQQLAITLPTWTQSFRVIDQVRKIFISKDFESKIIVEFTYNKRLRQQITDLNKNLEGQMISTNSKQYSIPLTEKNIYNVVKEFKSQGFDIDPVILKFYNEIADILKTTTTQFDVFSITNDKMLSAIKSDIVNVSNDNLTLLNDRRLRFQYSVYQKNSDISLTNSIANRPSTRVWIDSTTTSLDEVISSLQELNRLPILIIFNGHESKDCLQSLKKLSTSLINNNINSSIGIYFRFDSITESNKEFNTLISQLGYNAKLDTNTTVSGIANNKLPKFMIKNGWYPKSVISFSNNFKSNKTSVYCDAVDLIVYYNEKRPLGGADAIV